MFVFFFQAEDGIRDLVRSRGLGDVYKRQGQTISCDITPHGRQRKVYTQRDPLLGVITAITPFNHPMNQVCLLYTSDAADERSSVDLGGRRIIKKKNKSRRGGGR